MPLKPVEEKKTRYNFSTSADEGGRQIDALCIAVSEAFSKTRCRGRGMVFIRMGDSTIFI